MSNIKVLNFSVYIERPSQVVKVPVARNIVNSYDGPGNLLGLPRLENQLERNPEYRERIWDAAVHPTGPDYLGCEWGIARDFGIISEKTINIDLKINSDGSVVAESPRVDILPNRIVLYSDWRPDGSTAVIDKEIRTYQQDDPGFYLKDLVDEINTSSSFTATIYNGIRPNMHTSNLIRKSSDFMVTDEVKTDKRTELFYDYIAKDSYSFEDTITFRTRVEGAPSADGEYQVDHTLGEIFSYSLPDGDSDVFYHAALFPMIVYNTPIQLFTLQDDDFIDELFYKKTLDSGEEINALPNVEGSEILHQLFLETQIFWSK